MRQQIQATFDGKKQKMNFMEVTNRLSQIHILHRPQTQPALAACTFAYVNTQ